jgi:hypothetical protein
MAGIENVKKTLGSSQVVKEDGDEVTLLARDSEAPSKKQRLDNGQARTAIATKSVATTQAIDHEIIHWGKFTKTSTVLDDDRKHEEFEDSSERYLNSVDLLCHA